MNTTSPTRKQGNRLTAMVAIATGLMVGTVQAAELTWDGGASGDWNTGAANPVWLDGATATPWVAGSDAFFGTFGGEVAVTLTEGVTASSVQANANAPGDGVQTVRISGAHTLTLTGAGAPPLVGLSPATLTLNRRRSLVIEADIEVSGSPTGSQVFDVRDGLASDILDLQGNISGSDNINFRIAVNAPVRISGDNSSYTGRMELRAATTEIGSDTALGAGAAATVIGSGGDNLLLRAINGTRTIGNNLTREVSSSARTNRFDGDFIFTGDLSLTNNNQTWIVDVVSGTTTFGGGVATGLNHSLRKEGTGTLAFTGDNTPFGGGVNVRNGTLRIDGAWGNQKNYTIGGLGNTATLAGGGTINVITGNTVTVLEDGVIRPSSTLTLNADEIIFESGSTLQLDALGSMIVVGGDLTLENGSVLVLESAFVDQSSNVVLGTYAGTLTGEFGSVPGLPDLWHIDYGSGSGSEITLMIIPEPASVFLLGLGGILALRRHRTARASDVRQG